MLYAKISPAVQVVIQTGPFTTETVSVEHVSIVTRYVMGNSSNEFTVSYGSPVYNMLGNFDAFKTRFDVNLKLSAEEIASWGTDDETIFNIVAQKQGFQVVEFIDSDVPIPTTTTTTTTVVPPSTTTTTTIFFSLK